MGFVQIHSCLDRQVCGYRHRKKDCSTHLILRKAPEGKPVLFYFSSRGINPTAVKNLRDNNAQFSAKDTATFSANLRLFTKPISQ